MGIFGDQNQESDPSGWENDIDLCQFQFTGITGTYTGSISVDLEAVPASPNNKMIVGLYKATDLSKVAVSAEMTGLVTGWQTANLIGSFTLTNNAYYWLVVSAPSGNAGYSAAGAIAGQHGWDTRAYDGTLPDPMVIDSTEQKICSIYCTYTAAGGATLEQEGFRFRNDDGSESGATWKANQDANVTVPKNQNTRLRMLINATGDPAADSYQLEWRKTNDPIWRKVAM